MPLQIIRQDITKMHVDAIVNTTNEEKVGYSGVDLAVHTVGGSGLDEECASLPPLSVGMAQITGGYNLPCRYVIHTAGPIWYGGAHGEVEALRSCYIESLKLAVEYGCETVAFPLISSGVYSFPKEMVLKFAIQTITEFLFEHELTVYICVFDKESYTFSRKLFNDIREFIDDGYVKESRRFYEEASALCEEDTAPPSRSMMDICASSAPPTKPPRRRRTDEKYAVPPLCESVIPEKGRPPVRERSDARRDAMPSMCNTAAGKSLGEYLNQLDRSFAEMLFDLIDESGMTDVECYKRANVDKRVFSKIKSNKNYRPSKQTAVAFAISLRLNLEDTQELLATAGMTLSRSNKFDKIIRYFIHNGNYDVFEINEALFEFDQVLLGSVI